MIYNHILKTFQTINLKRLTHLRYYYFRHRFRVEKYSIIFARAISESGYSFFTNGMQLSIISSIVSSLLKYPLEKQWRQYSRFSELSSLVPNRLSSSINIPQLWHMAFFILLLLHHIFQLSRSRCCLGLASENSDTLYVLALFQLLLLYLTF